MPWWWSFLSYDLSSYSSGNLSRAQALGRRTVYFSEDSVDLLLWLIDLLVRCENVIVLIILWPCHEKIVSFKPATSNSSTKLVYLLSTWWSIWSRYFKKCMIVHHTTTSVATWRQADEWTLRHVIQILA
jgi:hypothetical protein